VILRNRGNQAQIVELEFGNVVVQILSFQDAHFDLFSDLENSGKPAGILSETVPDSSEILKLYSRRILALAANIPHSNRLENPDYTAKERSPLCGSTVTVDLNVSDGRVTAFGQDVKACALGQASASVLGKHVIGRSSEEIRHVRDQLKAMLKSDGPVPDPPFEELEALRPAREFKNRHASIMLAYDATIEAARSGDVGCPGDDQCKENHRQNRQ